jgi:hypothetical protein
VKRIDVRYYPRRKPDGAQEPVVLIRPKLTFIAWDPRTSRPALRQSHTAN